jgi:hypothetical protein
MSRPAATNAFFAEMSPAVVAYLIDKRFVVGWPFELTDRGRAVLRDFPVQNVHRRIILGHVDESYMISTFTPSEGAGGEASSDQTPEGTSQSSPPAG